jgi:hypothetical protein
MNTPNRIPSYAGLVSLWFVIGAGYSLAQTPSGRLLRRSSHAEDRPALFAAQFALSHACWLVTYPLAGWSGAAFGLSATSNILAIIAGCAAVAAAWLWPAADAEVLEHAHDGLPSGHEHWEQGLAKGGNSHAHAYGFDNLQISWGRMHPEWNGVSSRRHG